MVAKARPVRYLFTNPRADHAATMCTRQRTLVAGGRVRQTAGDKCIHRIDGSLLATEAGWLRTRLRSR